MKRIDNISLRQRLSVVVAAGILLIAAILGGFGQYLYDQKDQEFRRAYVSGLEALWKAQSANERDKMSGSFKNLTRNRRLSEALFRGQLTDLRVEVGPTATRLEALGIADNLLIVTVKGEIGFSNLPTVTAVPKAAEQVRTTGKLAEGFERTRDGRLINIVAFPIFDRADLVGIGAYEKGLDQLTRDIAEATGLAAFVRDLDGNIQGKSMENIPSLGQVDTLSAGFMEVRSNARTLGVAVVPLLDLAGEHVASLVTVEDITLRAGERDTIRLASYLATFLLLLAVTFGTWFYLKVSFRALLEAGVVVEAISKGDLAHRQLATTSSREMSRILVGIADMRESLQLMIRGILDATSQLSAAAEQTSRLTQRAMDGAQRQQGDTQAVATAMSQLSATTGVVASNAQAASAGARSADEEAIKGQQEVGGITATLSQLLELVGRAEAAIVTLKADSEAIGKVLDVIRSISTQTNQLALNAAIEASKAGEQGRGFGVVASEVRSLATRTRDSIEEIQAMIVTLQDSAQTAVDIMAQGRQSTDRVAKTSASAARSLDAITAAVGSIADMNSTIATAVKEQTTVAEDINANLARISQVAEETTEGARQTAEATAMISQQVRELQRQVDRFQI